MKPPPSNPAAAGDDAIRDTAARWVVRQDRRLTPAETRELATWLAADPRHPAAYGRSAASWRRFRAIATVVQRAPDETSAPRGRSVWPALGGLAAALALAFLAIERPAGLFVRTDSAPTRGTDGRPAPATRHFADGSTARLRDGAEILEAFTASERRVRLACGEAYFAVERDPARPFLVEVGGVTVRAVGTAFAVRFEPHGVDVLVTEGTVQVTPPAAGPAAPGGTDQSDASALVRAGHRAVVAAIPAPRVPPVIVTRVTPAEMARTLAWRGPMLEMGGATLGEWVAAFTARTQRRIEIADPALAGVRIGGRFPDDDVDGFVRALETVYDLKAETRADGTLVLRRRR